MKTLILGSSSPRRYELLNQLFQPLGFTFQVIRPDIDETPRLGEPADQYVERLSREKAEAILSTHFTVEHLFDEDALIITADTTVADGDQIIGKPDDADHATQMLRQLRGRTHYVYTGVSVLDTATSELITLLTTTQVIMRAYTDEEIAAYIASGDPFGKAGSYAIQNAAFHPVAQIAGCYTNVVGLPLCAVCALLTQHGTPVSVPCSPQRLPCAFSTH